MESFQKCFREKFSIFPKPTPEPLSPRGTRQHPAGLLFLRGPQGKVKRPKTVGTGVPL